MQQGESADLQRFSGQCLRTMTAKIDHRRKAAYETELIWWKGGREESEGGVDRKRT